MAIQLILLWFKRCLICTIIIMSKGLSVRQRHLSFVMAALLRIMLVEVTIFFTNLIETFEVSLISHVRRLNKNYINYKQFLNFNKIISNIKINNILSFYLTKYYNFIFSYLFFSFMLYFFFWLLISSSLSPFFCFFLHDFIFIQLVRVEMCCRIATLI